MKKNNFILSFALCGFIVSFFFGLFSGSNFLRIIGIALIFAICFAILGILIQFVISMFLNVDFQEPQEVAKQVSSSKTGNNIDIVIKDEDLPTQENEPQFFVGEKHQMLNKTDYEIKNEANAEEKLDKLHSEIVKEKQADENVSDSVNNFPNEAKSGASKELAQETNSEKANDSETQKDAFTENENSFIPISLQQTSQVISSDEANIFSDTKFENVKKDETLDELPDLQDLSSGSVVDDSDFSSPSSKSMHKDENKFNSKDTELIAKAISTVLVKDKENQ